MRIKYQLNFLLESKKGNENNMPINAVVTYGNQRQVFFTGHRIGKTQWIKESEGEKVQRVKKNNYNKAGLSFFEINQELSLFESTIKSIFEYYGGIEIFPTKEQLKAEVKTRLNKTLKIESSDLFELFEIYCKEAKVSEGRRRHLYTTKKHFERFSNTLRQKLTFANCNTNTIRLFEKYLGEPRKKEKAKSQNTISGELKRLRAFFRWSKHPEIFNDYKIISEQYGDPICLTKEERDKLFYFDIKDEKLSQVRYMFVLQCLIGCRVNDFINLRKDNIINGCIQYIAQKTKDKSQTVLRIPLSEKAKFIINKYDCGNLLFPFFHPVEYNEIIKTVFRICGLTRNVVRLNPLTRQNEIVELCTIASSHLARRTFIDIMHKAGIKNEVIASMTGHVEDSRSFARYRNIDDSLRLNAIKSIS